MCIMAGTVRSFQDHQRELSKLSEYVSGVENMLDKWLAALNWSRLGLMREVMSLCIIIITVYVLNTCTW